MWEGGGGGLDDHCMRSARKFSALAVIKNVIKIHFLGEIIINAVVQNSDKSQ